DNLLFSLSRILLPIPVYAHPRTSPLPRDRTLPLCNSAILRGGNNHEAAIMHSMPDCDLCAFCRWPGATHARPLFELSVRKLKRGTARRQGRGGPESLQCDSDGVTRYG